VGVPRIRLAKEGDAAPEGSPAAVAAYVAALTSDLAALARRHDLATLGYLLDMARLEAEGIVQRSST
jgi:hypothetical protein